MSNSIIQHLTDLRQAMVKANVDAYIQPSADPHLSEYVAPRFKGREFLTGFTGSAGTCVVTQDAALLFTDGRYFIQAEKELAGSTITLMKIGIEGFPTIEAWLLDHLEAGMTLGLDGRLFSHHDLLTLTEPLIRKGIQIQPQSDFISLIWQEQPSFPKTPVILHALKYTGQSATEKINLLRVKMSKHYCHYYMLSSLNDIAWLFNIRANDVAYTPVTYAYALISATEACLYLHKDQLTDTINTHLTNGGITILPYENYYTDLAKIKDQVIYCDPLKVNSLMTDSVAKNNRLILNHDLVFHLKSTVTPVEVANWHNAQVRDGVAMVQFLHWLDQEVTTGTLSEYQAEVQLEAFRQKQDLFVEPSFRTISAYGPNGAMMHYSAPESLSSTIEPRGLYLLDSGGQYHDGTTDITRTIAVGPLTDEEKLDFTLVVKAHIRLNQITFLSGATGSNLDIIARQPMWERHMDYKSGTGHSIGYFLGVHEGPARIRKEGSDVVLKPGMVLSNEPGVYKEGQYGIRIENTVLVKEIARNATGTYLGFDVMSYCPIDLRGIDSTLLSDDERQWLNNYHENVYSVLSPYLSDTDKLWLNKATQAL